MGRTIPSFRIAGEIEEPKWRPFRLLLNEKDRKMFDEMFSYARLYNSACMMAAWSDGVKLFSRTKRSQESQDSQRNCNHTSIHIKVILRD